LATHADEGLFFQGVIDLAFFERDGWVLVDYKSGGNRGKTDEDVRRQYGLQLGIYRKALHDATGQTVKEGWIYFTANGRSVHIF
jgi:ATP-dependent helicase/nuclease subunit A